jgi:UDP-N-acetylmuramate dehydrogenase
VLTAEAFGSALARWKKSGSPEAIPSFPAAGQARGAEAGQVKVPAAWLVEHAGFTRGYREGNVGISANHALALVNYGGTTKSLLALAGKIQDTVQETFDITLEREPVIMQ